MEFWMEKKKKFFFDSIRIIEKYVVQQLHSDENITN